MDPLTILIAVAGIIATGALTKVGENVTDAAASNSAKLISLIGKKSPSYAALITEASAQHPLDYGRAYLEIDALSKDDPDL